MKKSHSFGERGVMESMSSAAGGAEGRRQRGAGGREPRARPARTAARPGRNAFDLSVSAPPGGSEQAGGREKTKTRKQGPGGGAGAPRALRPRAKVGGRVGGRWVGGPVGWSTGRVGRVDQWGGRGGWGWLYCCLGGQNACKSACFEAFRPQNRPVFVFQTGGPAPLTGRAGEH